MGSGAPYALRYRGLSQAQWARRLARRWLPDVRAAAWECGYALGLHGSVSRDIDLIAAPWIKHAASAEVLATRICELVGGWRNRVPSQRPHGRLGWSIHFPECPHVYLDLSVMPRR